MQFKTLLPPRIKDFFDPRFVILFAIGATVVAFAANALYDFAKGTLRLQEFHWLYLFLFVGAGFSLFFGAWALKKRVEAVIETRSGKKRAPRKRALIVLGSNADVVKKAIDHHSGVLAIAWVVVSKETARWAEAIAKEYTDDEQEVKTLQLKNPADWREVADLVHETLANLPPGIQLKDAIVDFTGLPKPASVGAALAALHMGASLQWIPQTTTINPDGTKTLKAGDPEEQDIDYHAFPPSVPAAAGGPARPVEGS